MRFASSAAAAALLVSNVFGHPHASSTPRSGALQPRAIDLSAFRLKTKAVYNNATVTAADPIVDTLVKRATYVETATDLVSKVAPGLEFRLVTDHYVSDNGIAHVNFKQTVHGLDIDNADFNVNVDSEGTVFSFGNSFYYGKIPEVSPLVKREHLTPVEALQSITSTLALPIEADTAVATPEETSEHYVFESTSGTVSPPKARLVYFQNDEQTLALTWRVETDINDNWLLSYVDANAAGTVYGVVDYVSDATYNVYPFGINDPSKGSRSLEVNPHDTTASPFTWEGIGTSTYTTTRGNNGDAQVNYAGDDIYITDYRPAAAANQIFNYPYSLTATDPKVNQDASVAQLFYTANMYHDLLYTLGFNEVSGNFQTNNNGKGGLAGDSVILNAQDGSGTNNANFATPVDGQKPRMRMFIWTLSTPVRDCAFDSSVVIHEYTHGLSTRLTGGPANSGCLSVLEAGGMGEGWGDFMALAVNLKTTDTRAKNYALGDWVYNNAAGIRQYLYSTSLTTNPLTYKSVNAQTAVHAIGTTWATILYEVLWNLVEKHGITTAKKPTFVGGVPSDGRYLTMKLVVDAMKLQPCSPTFIQARDAIIDADKALTGGVNACQLWTAFAKRGLGSGASRGSSSTSRVESMVIPSGVC